jgi:hypothetical protein
MILRRRRVTFPNTGPGEAPSRRLPCRRRLRTRTQGSGTRSTIGRGRAARFVAPSFSPKEDEGERVGQPRDVDQGRGSGRDDCDPDVAAEGDWSELVSTAAKHRHLPARGGEWWSRSPQAVDHHSAGARAPVRKSRSAVELMFSLPSRAQLRCGRTLRRGGSGHKERKARPAAAREPRLVLGRPTRPWP